MKILEYPKIGDIGCTKSNKFLGKSIRWMQKMQGEGESEVNHVFWSINYEGLFVEALNKVEKNSIECYLEEYQDVYIVRIKEEFLCQEKLFKAVNYAINKYENKGYGYGKIFLQTLDTIFRTNKFTGSSFSNFPYCSELVAKSLMRKCGFLFYNGKLNRFLDPKSVNPANVLNDALDRPKVFEVYKYILVRAWKN
jgi:hypothetical protein